MKEENEVRKIKAVPKKETEIGIDTKHTLQDDIIYASSIKSLDMSSLENFSTVSQRREQLYQTIDTMSQDSTLASVIETYAEDVVQPNDQGDIFWVESSDDDCSRLVKFYLDVLNLDKNAYDYAISLIKYGDLYLQLFKESDYKEDPLFKSPDRLEKNNRSLLTEALNANLDEEEEKDELTEDVKVAIHSDNEHYALYVEKVNNPGEMFELVKHGKTRGYIKAPAQIQNSYNVTAVESYNVLNYRMNKRDVTLYDSMDFVHAYLSNAVSRDPEKVEIILGDKEGEANVSEYTVRRGASILSDIFKIWRELSLLENSVLLNRITKSSVIRMYQVELGDMSKNKARSTLSKIKELIEQKTAINTGNTIQEYTNPGPMENSVILPVHEGKGAVSQTTIGGDIDPKQLTDLDWFNNKMYGALRIPKQYFGWTDDGAGFSGGQSLSIISSRYGKAVKRIQKSLIECVTDLINLFLIDRGQSRFVNKFKIRMQEPLTQEELDRRQDNDNRIRYIGDIMTQLVDLPDPTARLKILKSLLSSSLVDQEIVGIIQEEIDKLEAGETPVEETGEEGVGVAGDLAQTQGDPIFDLGDETLDQAQPLEDTAVNDLAQQADVGQVTPIQQSGEQIDTYLPSPSELGKDMTQNG